MTTNTKSILTYFSTKRTFIDVDDDDDDQPVTVAPADDGAYTIQRFTSAEDLQLEWELVTSRGPKGRNTPKPTSICETCHEVVFVRAGVYANIRPHFSHLANTECKGRPDRSGETPEHHNAKYMFAKKLNKLEQHISVTTLCSICGHRDTRELKPKHSKLEFGVEIRQSWGSRFCVWDIFGRVPADPSKCVGIEIKHTHFADNIDVRDNVTWYEFDTADVLKQCTISGEKCRDMLMENIRNTCTDRAGCAQRHHDAAEKKRIEREAAERIEQERQRAEQEKLVVHANNMRAIGRLIGCYNEESNKFIPADDSFHCLTRALIDFVEKRQCLMCSSHCYWTDTARPYCLTCRNKIMN